MESKLRLQDAWRQCFPEWAMLAIRTEVGHHAMDIASLPRLIQVIQPVTLTFDTALKLGIKMKKG